MSITPVYPRHQYNQQATGKCPYKISGTNIFASFTSNQFEGSTPISSVVSGYSDVYQDEVFYVLTRNKLFAILVNGPKVGTSIHADSILWTFTLSKDDFVATTFSLTLSEDGNTIYCNPYKYNYTIPLLAINTNNGSTKWSVNPTSAQYSFYSPIVEDADGNIHVLVYYTYSFQERSYIYKYNYETGVLIKTYNAYDLLGSRNLAAPQILTDYTKNYLFIGVYDNRISGWTPTIIRLDKDYNNIVDINIDDAIHTSSAISSIAFDSDPIYGTDIVYALTTTGLHKADFRTVTKSWSISGDDPSNIGPQTRVSIDTNGTIYYRANEYLYAINPDGSTKWENSSLPIEDGYVSPIIDKNNNIIVTSRNYGFDNNIHVLNHNTGIVISSYRVCNSNRRIELDASLGNALEINNNILYVPIYDSTTTSSYIYLLNGSGPESTSSEDLDDITPVYPRHTYDQQGTSNIPYKISGTQIFGVFSSKTFNAKTPISSIVSGYSNIYQDEVFYVASEDKIFAVLANGSKTGSSINGGSILWSFSGFSPTAFYGVFGLVLSNDGNTIYWNNNKQIGSTSNSQLFAINTINGSLKWNTPSMVWISPWHNQFVSPIIEDKYGNIHILYFKREVTVSVLTPRYYYYIQKYNKDTGLKDEHVILKQGQGRDPIASNIPLPCTYLTTNVEKNTLFCGFHIKTRYDGDFSYAYKVKINDIDETYESVTSVTLQTPTETYIEQLGLTYNWENNDILYIVTKSGLFKINFGIESQEWYYAGTNPSAANVSTSPAIATDGTIYYRAANKLYAINPDGTEKWSYSFLPIEDGFVTPIIDKNNNIIVTSRNYGLGTNVHTFDDSGILLSSFRVGDQNKRIELDISLGDAFGSTNNILYAPLYDQNTTNGFVYLLNTPEIPPVPQSTSSASSTSSESDEPPIVPSSSSNSLSSTSSEDEPIIEIISSPLRKVITEVFPITNKNTLQDHPFSASDNIGTIATPFAVAFNFGTIAPGEKSQTVIVALNVPYASAIQNIKLALIDTGGITFTDDNFGITSSHELRSDITPMEHFKGINLDNSELNAYNISISNRNNLASNYVYLNINLPRDNFLGSGVIRLKWFFDYN